MTIGLRIGPARGGANQGALLGYRSGLAASTTTTLTATLTDSANPVMTAAPLTYTSIVSNTGGITANTVSVVITLNASLTYVSSAGTGWTIGVVGQVVTCTLASLAAGASAPAITIDVTTGATAVTASSGVSATATETVSPGTATQTTSVLLVSKDATAGVRVPADATEWANLIAAAGLTGTVPVPDALWLCQEASGNLADSIGTFTLTGVGTRGYAATVGGWARKAISTGDNLSGYWESVAVGLPDISVSPLTIMSYTIVTTAGSFTRSVLSAGLATSAAAMYCGGPLTGLRIGSGVNAFGGSVSQSGQYHPYVLLSDKAAGRAEAYNAVEKVTVTPGGGVSGQRMALGGVPGVVNPPAFATTYAAAWFAAPTAANLKTILQTAGWTIAWS